MSARDTLLALADRCEAEPPSRELDRDIEIALRGMLARTNFPPAHTHANNRAGVAQTLRERAAAP